MGGSVFMWDPELKIGFGYLPFDCMFLDFVCYKGSFIQQAMSDTVRKMRAAK